MDKIRLYHYSNVDFKGKIEPRFFGVNHYTKNSVKEAVINRSFFYIGRGKEAFLQGCKFCYIAEIEKSKIYDLVEDKKGLKDKFCFNDLLIYVKNLGYYGISGNNGFKVICLFKGINYIDKKQVADYPLKSAKVLKRGQKCIKQK